MAGAPAAHAPFLIAHSDVSRPRIAVGHRRQRQTVVSVGYDLVIARSREPATLSRLVAELGPLASASTTSGAAAAGDFIVVAVPVRLGNDMPAEALAGRVVIDTDDYMARRDGNYAIIDPGGRTEHELRQEQLPASKVVGAFTQLQAPRIIGWGSRAALSAGCRRA